MTDAVVCGAGTAGLSAAATLQRAGLEVVVLERSGRVGASWRTRYPALRLNTPGWMSTQPGFRATRGRYGEFPSRDQWIRYLEDYCDHHRLDVRFDTEVHRIDRHEGGWRVHANGAAIAARAVVVATGFDHEPNLPDWLGQAGFTGDLVHSSAYVGPEPYAGRDVLVVGPGVSGSEIAFLVLEGGAARVRVSCRTPPHFYKRKLGGVPPQVIGAALNHVPLPVADRVAWIAERMTFGDLSRFGLPKPPIGAATQLAVNQQAPACDAGFLDAVRAGRIEIVAAVVGFDGPAVLLADGSRLEADAVIAATGYRRGLTPLVGHLGVLDERETPIVTGGRQHPDAPGLFFAGFRGDLSGQLRLMRHDARSIARAVSRREPSSTSGARPAAAGGW